MVLYTSFTTKMLWKMVIITSGYSGVRSRVAGSVTAQWREWWYRVGFWCWRWRGTSRRQDLTCRDFCSGSTPNWEYCLKQIQDLGKADNLHLTEKSKWVIRVGCIRFDLNDSDLPRILGQSYMDTLILTSLLVWKWEYLRSPAKNFSIFCRVSKIGNVMLMTHDRWFTLW